MRVLVEGACTNPPGVTAGIFCPLVQEHQVLYAFLAQGWSLLTARLLQPLKFHGTDVSA